MDSRVVVVGYGMAGARFAERIRQRDPESRRVRLTVLGAEPYRAYNRVLLSTALGGGLDLTDVHVHGPDWASRHHVDVRTCARVRSIDRLSRQVVLADGSAVGYDHLVLATGCRPWLPPVDGLARANGGLAPGVATFRDLDDCRRIRAFAGKGSRIAVVGGGLLGLEAARGLAGAGSDVTIVHPVGHLMERQLDAIAGRVLHDGLTRLGIDVRLCATATRWQPGHGLQLDDGSWLTADAVVVSAGARPRTSLARRAKLAVDRGIVVDDRLTTSDEHIHAIGDCAQHRGVVVGLVQPAWDQAEVLADRLTDDDPDATYAGTPHVVRLKAAGIELTALGDVHAEADEHTEALRLEDSRRGRYGKLVLRDDRVVGAIMLGLPDAAANVIRLFDTTHPAPADRLALLLGRALPSGDGTPHTPASDDIVCRCNGVTMRHLEKAWQGGARTVAELTGATRATTGCGGCEYDVETIVNALADPKEQVA